MKDKMKGFIKLGKDGSELAIFNGVEKETTSGSFQTTVTYQPGKTAKLSLANTAY